LAPDRDLPDRIPATISLQRPGVSARGGTEPGVSRRAARFVWWRAGGPRRRSLQVPGTKSIEAAWALFCGFCSAGGGQPSGRRWRHLSRGLQAWRSVSCSQVP